MRRKNTFVDVELFAAGVVIPQRQVGEPLFDQIVPEEVEKHFGPSVNERRSGVGEEVLIDAAPVGDDLAALERVDNVVVDDGFLVAQLWREPSSPSKHAVRIPRSFPL